MQLSVLALIGARHCYEESFEIARRLQHRLPGQPSSAFPLHTPLSPHLLRGVHPGCEGGASFKKPRVLSLALFDPFDGLPCVISVRWVVPQFA